LLLLVLAVKLNLPRPGLHVTQFRRVLGGRLQEFVEGGQVDKPLVRTFCFLVLFLPSATFVLFPHSHHKSQAI